MQRRPQSAVGIPFVDLVHVTVFPMRPPIESLCPEPSTYSELRLAGLTRRRIEKAVRSGELIRVRKGRYLSAGHAPDTVLATRLGGRIDCVSLLRALGVFVLDGSEVHIVVGTGSSRLSEPPRRVIRHWRLAPKAEDQVIEALAQACRCQGARAAIATLDSALHLGLIDEAGLAEIFERLPRRRRALRSHIDGRSESGPETFVRLMLKRLRCRVELQAAIDGVGRVDFLVDGWLIVECDSRQFHANWKARRKDHRRDLAAARLGYGTLRIAAEDIMYSGDDVFAALRGSISSRRGVHKSSSRLETALRTAL